MNQMECCLSDDPSYCILTSESDGDLEVIGSCQCYTIHAASGASRRLQDDFIVYRARPSSQNFIAPTANKARCS